MNTEAVTTCWEHTREGQPMRRYVAAVCLTGVTAEAAVDPAQLRAG